MLPAAAAGLEWAGLRIRRPAAAMVRSGRKARRPRFSCPLSALKIVWLFAGKPPAAGPPGASQRPATASPQSAARQSPGPTGLTTPFRVAGGPERGGRGSLDH